MAADFALDVVGGGGAALAWVGAEFITATAVVLWDSDGRAFAFDVSPPPPPLPPGAPSSAAASAAQSADDDSLSADAAEDPPSADDAGAAAAAAAESSANGITLLCRLDRCRSAAERAAAAGGAALRRRRVVPWCTLRSSLPAALRRGQQSTAVPVVVGTNASCDGVATWVWCANPARALGGAGVGRSSFASSTASINVGWPQLAPAPSLRTLFVGAAVRAGRCEFSFIYRYIGRESCSQFDSLPLTSLTIPQGRGGASKVAASPSAALRVTCAAALLISSGGAQPWTSRDTLLIARVHVDPATWDSSLTLLQMPLVPNAAAVVTDAALCAARPGAFVTCIAFLPQRGELHAANAASGDARRTRCHIVTGDSEGARSFFVGLVFLCLLPFPSK
jgi:hypothetical protein